MTTDSTRPKTWLDFLGDEDLAFVKRFVLASGSLKKLAAAYGVTYPTIRLRLDRLIEKIKVVDEHQPMSDFERIARAQHADGRIDAHTLRLLLGAHQNEMENRDETSDRR